MLLDDEYEPRTRCNSFGDIVGSIVGTVGNVLGAREDERAGLRSQGRQYDLNKAMYQNRYQWQMEDMRLAGLNPILSYKQGAPSGPGVGGYSTNYAQAVAEGGRLDVARRTAAAQIANLRADTTLKGAQSEAARESALLSNSARTLNDISAMLRMPELHGTRELMELIKAGGRGSDIAAAINRLRVMLGGSGR